MYRDLIEPYKEIALRHLQMANALLRAKFHDSAFHVYHAYESIICAALVKRQPYNLPPIAHQTKLNRFQNVFAAERAIAQVAAKLSNSLYSIRNRVLYPEFRELLTVIRPAAAISEKQMRGYLSRVKQFVNQLIIQLKLADRPSLFA